MRLLCAGLLLGLAIGCAAPARSLSPDRCADTRAQVMGYKAPGASVTVGEAITLYPTVERRPVHLDGWTAPAPDGDWCHIFLHLSIGNAAESAMWRWHPGTGRVEAGDDLAKRLSGWQ